MKSGAAAEGGANSFPAMKMIRSALCFWAVPLFLALASPVQAQFTFTTNNGAITITGYTGSGGAVTIPDTTNGWPVTSIGDYAFDWCFTLTSITIPDSVTNIGNETFQSCNSLTNLTLGANVANLGAWAFYGCSSLASVTFGTNVASIGDYAFTECASLTAITIPEGVTNLGFGAFSDCASLSAITVAAGNPAYTSVAGVLFNQNQTTLIQYPEGNAESSYTIPDSVITIGSPAFDNCMSLTNVTLGTNVTSIEDFAFQNCGLASITIPSSVTSIGYAAFEQCASLTAITVNGGDSPYSSVAGVLFNQNQTTLIQYPAAKVGSSYTIPSSVTSIGDYAFESCASLSSITIPVSVTSIGGNAFAQCSSLASVNLPEGITSIGDNVFEGCGSLTNVTIPSSVTSIGSFAFDNCASLTSLTIPEGVTSIGEVAFEGCANLTSLVIPSGVTSIGMDTFQQCNHLTNVTISASVTTLEYDAFAWCPSLTGVYFLGNAPSADSTVFDNDSAAMVYYLPDTTGWSATFAGAPTATWNPPLGALRVTLFPATALTNGALWQVDNGGWQNSGATVSNLLVGDHTVSFRAAAGWTQPASHTVFVNSNQTVTVTGTYLPTFFNSTINGGTITITGYSGPGGALIIPNTINGWPVTGIGTDAFYNDTRLTSVTIGTKVTHIGNEAFADCTSLTAITVAAGNPAYASVAGVLFNKHQTVLVQYPAGKKASSYTIPNGVTNIGSEAFEQSASLTNVTLPNSVASIGIGAFENCTGLSSLEIPNSVTSLGNDICAECRSLTNLTIGTNVTSIGNYAFEDCTSLSGVTIPASVANLGFGAFNYCASLTAIMVASNNPAYSSMAGVLFNQNQTLLLQYPGGKAGGYTIPGSVTSVENHAFVDCSSLTSVTIPEGVTNLDNMPMDIMVLYSLEGPFTGCTSLSAIKVAAGNPVYSSAAGVLFNQDLTTLIEYPAGKAGSSYTIPNSVTNIGYGAFDYCDNLAGLFFQGNAPSVSWGVFNGDGIFAVYYPPGATGWSSTFGGVPATPWNPSAGVLQVTLLPTDVSFYGARWQVDNGAWQSSGVTVNNLSLGEHTVSFNSVNGWTSPASQTVLVGSNEITTATGTYVQILFDCATNNGTITITSYNGPGGAVIIPDTINGLPVTSLGDYAFEWRFNLTSVIIPDSVTNIGNQTFQSCSSLTNLTLGANVANLGAWAFSGCSGLASVTFGANLSSIGDYAFSDCASLTGITIPEGVTNLGFGAFSACASLSAITVAAGNPAYTSAAGVLFNLNQTTLIQYPEGKAGSSYTLPDGVINIGDSAFDNCTSLTNITLGNNLRSIGAFAFQNSGLFSITVPNSVTSIEYDAFQPCTNLMAITVNWGNPAYSSMAGVLFNENQTTLIQYPEGKAGSGYTIPSSVTRIADYAFEGCASLGSVTIPDSVASLGDYAFEGCANLTSLVIPSGVISIGMDTFQQCTSLTNVQISASVTSLEYDAFSWCPSLTGVYFLGNAPSADARVFDNATNVTVYYLPGTTGWGATFAGVPTLTWNPPLGALQATIFPSAAITNGAQWQVDNGGWQSSGTVVSNLLVGEHTVSFSTAAGWTQPASQTVFINSNQVETVTGTYMPTLFDTTINAGTITITGYSGPGGALTIPNTINGWLVTGIGSYAFYHDTGLTSVTIGTNVTNVGNEAFADCTRLNAITVAAGNPAYTSVAGVLFNQNHTVLVQYPAGKTAGSYTIPNSVTNIGNEAFEQCTSLTNITLPNSATSIGTGAFENCISLIRLKIPNSIASLGDYAFEECRSLTNVTFGTNLTSIGNNAFYDCTSLASVTIPASVTNLGFGAFTYCTSLTAITVAASNPAYSSVAGVLFNQNQTLLIQYPGGKAGGYTIPQSVSGIEINAYVGCSSLTSVTIPISVTNLSQTPMGRYIFYGLEGPFTGCTSLSAITVAAGNPVYSSEAGVLFNQDLTTLIEFPEGKAGNSYTIPNSVTNIGEGAFEYCDNLAGVFFQGNAPSLGGGAFNGDGNFAVYYPPEATGWSATFGGAPATPWNPAAGILQVTLLPTDVSFYGAQWQVDNGAWQNSGATVNNLSLGEHTVSFNTVNGWTTPATQTVLVGSNEIAAATGIYVPIPFGYSTNNGTVTIFSYFGPGGAIIIPDTINGLPVTSIEGLESGRLTPIFYSSPPQILIPANGTSIVGHPIIGSPITNGPITSVTIGSRVTNIAYGAFQNCPKLAAIAVTALNPAYTSVAGVLYNKQQTTLMECPEGKAGSSYTIPNSVTNLGDYAFSGCTNLTSITLGNRVTKFGYGAFSTCSSLTSILVDGNNPAYGSVAGVLFDKDLTTLIQYPVGKAGTAYTLPLHVLSIGSLAFRSCLKLTSVTIPNSVTTIGVGAFELCSNLTTVVIGNHVSSIGGFAFESTKLGTIIIPNSVTDIGPGVFDNCANLKGITVEALNPAYASVAGVLFNKKQTTLIQYPEAKAGATYTIPSRVLSIGNSAFLSCAMLTSVTIPDSVINIGNGAFLSCTHLTSATIGGHVMDIEDFAFQNTSLARVTIPNSVTNIGNWAFQSCTNLTSVMIGNHVINIGEFAFDNCVSLTSITIPSSVTSIGDSAFSDCTNLAGVYFQGNAPGIDSIGYGGEVFGDDNNATAYYRAGTSGWGSTFGGIPTALWSAHVRSNVSLGVQTNGFGFQLAGGSNQVIVVEACTNLVNPVWQPLQTNGLTGGSIYFSDPQWTNYPSRFYRVRSP